jgi:hypothetical protein
MFGITDLIWRGDRLTARGAGRAAFVEVVPDTIHAGMWRIRLPDGSLSDMVNRARSRDAAKSILMGILNTRQTPTGASLARSEPGARPLIL